MILKDTQLDGYVKGEGRSSFPSRIAAAAASCGERSRLLSVERKIMKTSRTVSFKYPDGKVFKVQVQEETIEIRIPILRTKQTPKAKSNG